MEQAYLTSILAYNPDTGELRWKPRPESSFRDGAVPASAYQKSWNRRCAGKPALTAVMNRGYLCGNIEGKMQLAHRVIWTMVHGSVPGFIDHINGDKQDNRLCNLRCVSRSENARNRKTAVNNTSGYTGVHKDTRSGKWSASIGLGYFDTLEEAAAARKKAEALLGYHANHGRPAA
jgi:hypothetical protein